jgi:hypothetical protein
LLYDWEGVAGVAGVAGVTELGTSFFLTVKPSA